MTKGDFIVIPAGAEHDLRNTGPDVLRTIAFFNDGEVEHYWRGMRWQNGAGDITGTPNRDGAHG